MAELPNIAAATLAEMRDEIAADSPLFADRLSDKAVDRGSTGFSDLFAAACRGPVQNEAFYLSSLEYIFEGYLLHYGESRLIEAWQRDFNLLAGDYMYARGLNRIAALGDLFLIKTLADLVELCSYIHCEGLGGELALDIWSVVTLCLAGHASDDDSCKGECRPAFEDFIQGAWGTRMRGTALDVLREKMLSLQPEERRHRIEGILSNIYVAFSREPEA